MIVPRTNPNLITFWLATPISTHCQGPDLTLNFIFAARAATFLFFLVECNRRCAMWIMSYPSKDVLNGSCSPWRLVTADRQNMWKKLQLINWRNKLLWKWDLKMLSFSENNFVTVSSPEDLARGPNWGAIFSSLFLEPIVLLRSCETLCLKGV